MSKIHVYHHNDHDGIVAAGVLYNLYAKKNHHENDIIFYMIDYDKELNFDHIDLNTDEVYFLDYSFSNDYNKNEFKKLLNRRIVGDEVVWIDHHITSLNFENELQCNIKGIRNMCLCGAAWTYIWASCITNLFVSKTEIRDISKMFHEWNQIPKFIKLIDDYDCWKKLYSYTNDFHYGLTVSDPKDSIIGYLLSSENNPEAKIAEIIKTGNEIQKFLEFENREYHINMYGFEYTLPEEHGGLKCFCLNRKGNSLMFGDKINEYDAVIPFFYINGKWKYSIFTAKDGVNCEAVAKSYGGGGHLRAAGWITDELIFN